MLGFQEPLDCRTSYSGVLDLRTVKVGSTAASWTSDSPVSPPTGCRELTPSPRELTRSSSECSVLTPPRDTSLSPPMLDVVSPTLAITQRVLAAATAPQGTRPFKAYPKDPLTLSAQSDAYLQFRQHMLNQVCAKFCQQFKIIKLLKIGLRGFPHLFVSPIKNLEYLYIFLNLNRYLQYILKFFLKLLLLIPFLK